MPTPRTLIHLRALVTFVEDRILFENGGLVCPPHSPYGLHWSPYGVQWSPVKSSGLSQPNPTKTTTLWTGVQWSPVESSPLLESSGFSPCQIYYWSGLESSGVQWTLTLNVTNVTGNCDMCDIFSHFANKFQHILSQNVTLCDKP
jgi:hypothetical protein